ncbi:hypothetical protein L3X38_000252 (mitochondrion) [Prunus dulcis]|uniref:Uncharacterized protein n=1 Tax=Prunus dulcis TaxID=3755 RepID=A0AAD4YJL7_PRUDU|nr:hypothetical protein L3X38_000252 [Prunus dulcis]
MLCITSEMPKIKGSEGARLPRKGTSALTNDCQFLSSGLKTTAFSTHSYGSFTTLRSHPISDRIAGLLRCKSRHLWNCCHQECVLWRWGPHPRLGHGSQMYQPQ